MTDLRKAAEMALEALEYYRSFEDCQPTPASKTIPALRQALDKPVPLQSDRIRIDPQTGDVSIGTVDAVNMSQALAQRKTLAELLDATPVEEKNT